MRDDRQPVRLEDREERLVRLGDGHLLRRVDGRLDVADLAAEDEALAGELADDANELGQVGVLEREGDLVASGARLVLDARSNCVRPCVSAGRGCPPAPGRGRGPRAAAGAAGWRRRRGRRRRRRRRRGRRVGALRLVGPLAQLRERVGARSARSRRLHSSKEARTFVFIRVGAMSVWFARYFALVVAGTAGEAPGFPCAVEGRRRTGVADASSRGRHGVADDRERDERQRADDEDAPADAWSRR